MNSKTKLAVAIALFLSWYLLIFFKVQGAEDLISFIKSALIGLGMHAIHAAAQPIPPPK